MNTFITDHWNSYLLLFPKENKDIYFQEEYVKLYDDDDNKGKCIVVENNSNVMLFPFLSRTFFVGRKIYHDFETAYGYGGPILKKEDIFFKHAALQEMFDFLSRNDYIAGFIRFHPLLNNQMQFNIGQVIDDRNTVMIDLSLSVEDIWMKEIHTKNRNVIKKGAKEGLKFVVDDHFVHLNEFITLYNRTMDKLSADNFYYFSDDYYRKFVRNIPDSFLGLVYYNKQIIAAAIFMYQDEYGHYHLAGSDERYLKLAPNNFLLFHAALELKSRGVKSFHLGGGTTSQEGDSLFSFKSRFSKIRCQFSIGKLIFNHAVYEQQCKDWEVKNIEKVEHYKNFLLKYKY